MSVHGVIERIFRTTEPLTTVLSTPRYYECVSECACACAYAYASACAYACASACAYAYANACAYAYASAQYVAYVTCATLQPWAFRNYALLEIILLILL